MQYREEIIRLFQRYGFDFRKNASNHKFLAFTYKSGFFHNAEIVALEEDFSDAVEEGMLECSKELENLGFSTKRKKYKSFVDIEKSLFEGFFNVETWREKVESDYEDYSLKILSVLPSEAQNYSYIEAPYLKNNKREELTIIDSLKAEIRQSGPKLAIIEAPAGFGKTSTAYELIHSLATNSSCPLPFFTEFSRDRQARIFSHIFIREVDRSFSSVNSDVVIDEVKEGNIVVVLDGFDELLHDNGSDSQEAGFENAEPMLDTISELLEKNAKVVLTTRKTALFEGELFYEWIEKYEENFEIIRYKIDRPRVRDWLTLERIEQLENHGIKIDYLANPVLLSYLSFMSEQAFKELVETPERIVEQYFIAMLDREMERQELRMNAQQQSSLLTMIAMDMCENNYTTDKKDKIVGLIKEKAHSVLQEVRMLYAAKDRPSIDKLATTLSNHAFFDRSNQHENNIEFINEFVFGNYIAQGILLSHGDWIASDERFVEPAVISYEARALEEKNKLWSSLGPMSDFLEKSKRMSFEGSLIGAINDQAYDEEDIASITLQDVDFFPDNALMGAVFNQCTFKNVRFYIEHLTNITFLNCDFWSCEYILSSPDNKNYYELNFYNCRVNNEFISDVEGFEEEQDSNESDSSAIRVDILNKIWPVGSKSIERLHFFTGNLFKNTEFSRKQITKEIKKLKRDEILLDANDSNFIAINKEKFAEIKYILGRNGS